MWLNQTPSSCISPPRDWAHHQLYLSLLPPPDHLEPGLLAPRSYSSTLPRDQSPKVVLAVGSYMGRSCWMVSCSLGWCVLLLSKYCNKSEEIIIWEVSIKEHISYSTEEEKQKITILSLTFLYWNKNWIFYSIVKWLNFLFVTRYSFDLNSLNLANMKWSAAVVDPCCLICFIIACNAHKNIIKK